MAEDRGPRVPALIRAVRVLDMVAVEPVPPGVTEIAKRLGLPKSSVHNICASLTDERMLLRGADGSFRLGPRVFELGAVVPDRERTGATVAVSVQNGTNPFFDAEIAAAREEAERSGARLIATHAGADPARQDAQIREFVDAGAEIVLVDPVDSLGLSSAADYAHARNVVIVAINGAATNFDAAVTTDNTRAGVLAGEHFGRLFPRGARIAIIDGTRVTAIADRIDGFRRALGERGGFEVVAHATGDNSEKRGRELAAGVLDRHDGIQAFFAINDPTALGVSQACRERDLTIPVIGVDGSAAAVDEIRRGGNIVATAVQDPSALGRTGVHLGFELAAGRRPLHRTILLPTQLITAAEAEEYEPW